MIRRPPRSTLSSSSAASDVYKRQTYTIDTLRELKAAYGDVELFFITGADALAQILDWHAPDELFRLAHFVGVTRPGFVLARQEEFPVGTVSLLEVPALAISSSDCRARVQRNAPVWYLVPDGVVQYLSLIHISEPARLLSIS